MTFISTATCNPARVERLVTPKTKVILPVHYAGQLADMEPLLDIARRPGLAILEDAAEAHGCAAPRTPTTSSTPCSSPSTSSLSPATA